MSITFSFPDKKRRGKECYSILSMMSPVMATNDLTILEGKLLQLITKKRRPASDNNKYRDWKECELRACLSKCRLAKSKKIG